MTGGLRVGVLGATGSWHTRRLLDALAARGVPVACLQFDGEGHGFRRAENIIRAKEAELYFYGKVMGFEPADEIEPVEIQKRL